MEHSIDVIHQKAKEAFDTVAEKYHALFRNEMKEKPYDRAYLDNFCSLLPENALVCDAGCGPSGHIGRYLFDKGINTFGIDISPRCVELARAYNPAMQFQCVDFLDWQQSAETLDGILAFYSIIYTPRNEVGKILSVFHDTLKKGGQLVVVVKEGSFEGYQPSVLGYEVHPYFTEYSMENLQQALEMADFQILDLSQRKAYSQEISNQRIYCHCRRR
jgi:2-polyprenyl-3-methyl-5-hydroxy-6-metoxy-1,4-benzoquinol methylase